MQRKEKGNAPPKPIKVSGFLMYGHLSVFNEGMQNFTFILGIFFELQAVKLHEVSPELGLLSIFEPS